MNLESSALWIYATGQAVGITVLAIVTSMSMMALLQIGRAASPYCNADCVKNGRERAIDMHVVEKSVKNWSRRNFPRSKRPKFHGENRAFVFCRTCSW